MASDQMTLQRQIVVSGEVQGDIAVETGTKLLIQEGATVCGDVRIAAGASAVIDGEVEGDVLAEGDLYIREGAVVNGSITAVRR